MRPRRLLFRVGPSIHPGRVHVAALPPRRAGDSSGILRFVPADDLFLPEPEPRQVRYTVISVDDHVVEPAHTFENRLPAALADGAPRIVETPEGHQVWEFEGQRYTQVGMNAVAGSPPGDLRAGAVPLRPDAARVLRRGRPRARHGHQRCLGLGEFPVHDHRLLRPRLLRRPRTATWAWPVSGLGTTGSSRSGTPPTPNGSSRSGSPTSPTPSSPWPRSGATPSGASRR